MSVRRVRALAALGLIVISTACGRKGNPLPPLPFAPARVGDPEFHRIGDRVEMQFKIPEANADGTTPSVLDRIEIYALATPAGTTAPTTAQVLEPANLKGRVEILHEGAPAAKPNEPDTRPEPGDVATFVDRAGVDRHGADAPVLHYVLVGVAGRSKKGPAAGPFDVPLSVEPPAPSDLKITYNDEKLTFAWRSNASDARFRVYEATPSGIVPDRAPLSPFLETSTFEEPVTFDAARCLTVRAAQKVGAVIIEGPAAPPRCETPVDTFPPPVPTGLVAFASEGSVDLTWDAVSAKDLAGYVVLRGEGSGDKLLPLPKPVPDPHYTDRDVKSGTTYWYAIVAQDTRGNASGPSTKQSATVRIP